MNLLSKINYRLGNNVLTYVKRSDVIAIAMAVRHVVDSTLSRFT